MGISLNITKETWGVGSLDWLAERLGFDTCRPGTVDITAFVAEHSPNGFIPSGTVLAKITATGLLAPYTPGGAGGIEVAFGHMLHDVRIADRAGNAFTRAGVAVLWQGVVLQSKLPNFIGAANAKGELDAAAITLLGNHIRYEP